ncbi:hypothetical protein RS84_00027 [Microbacterium hydrocarbonoxydans]|uniref:Uncharacterized protein n=1 Tax=Microbacterium hydrocarbonoxydans TaxID=273678 RepID=A0A0M2HYN0_9MICO|nr:hypothetical protein [Microbacterium hydrocarbonoxydans]KJL49553.1 hypothetical protein RS84_00027 [Microbacterium hydrocarbonoxydans]
MKKILTTTTALVLSLALMTGCAPTSRPDPTPTPTEEPVPTEPTLRVPETTTGTNVSLQVSGGNLPQGTKATIYRFDGRWDGEKPTCDDPNAETRTVVLNGDGGWQPVNFTVIPGVEHWVLVAGEYTTPCGDPKAQTVVKVETRLNVFTGGSEATKAGEPKEIAVEITSTPTPDPLSGSVLVYGPWKTLPEAEAGGCTDADPAFTLPLEIDYGGVSPRGTVELTPEEAGVYRVVVKIDENDQGTAVDTCEAGDSVTFNVATQ